MRGERAAEQKSVALHKSGIKGVSSAAPDVAVIGYYLSRLGHESNEIGTEMAHGLRLIASSRHGKRFFCADCLGNARLAAEAEMQWHGQGCGSAATD